MTAPPALIARKRSFFLTLDADAVEQEPDLVEEGKRPALLFRALTVAEISALVELGQRWGKEERGSGWGAVATGLREFSALIAPAWVGVRGSVWALGAGDGRRLLSAPAPQKMSTEERADLLISTLDAGEITRLMDWSVGANTVEEVEKKP